MGFSQAVPGFQAGELVADIVFGVVVDAGGNQLVRVAGQSQDFAVAGQFVKICRVGAAHAVPHALDEQDDVGAALEQAAGLDGFGALGFAGAVAQEETVVEPGFHQGNLHAGLVDAQLDAFVVAVVKSGIGEGFPHGQIIILDVIEHVSEVVGVMGFGDDFTVDHSGHCAKAEGIAHVVARVGVAVEKDVGGNIPQWFVTHFVKDGWAVACQ